MIIPLSVDVPMYRWPIANFAIVGLTIAAFFGIPLRAESPFILTGWEPTGLVGHMLLHAGIIHLVGNMIFLWVFGNAVCAKIGNFPYPLIYLLVGVGAAAIHLLFDGHPAVGASGAINGIVGMFLIWYPLNNITCFYFFGFYTGSFQVSSIWMILLWLAFDLLGVALGGGGVAYWAHIGGFAAGAGLAMLLLRTGLVKMRETERSLFDLGATAER